MAESAMLEEASTIVSKDRRELGLLIRSLPCIPPEENDALARIADEDVGPSPDEFEGLFAYLSG